MDIFLNKPTLPYAVRYYRHFMEKLCDRNIYDTSDVTVGARRIGPPPFTRKPAIAGLSFNSAPAPGLTPATYYYVVSAVFPDGSEGPPSDEASYVVTATGGGLTLNWSSVTGASSYRVFRTTVSGSYNNSLIATVGSAYSPLLDNGLIALSGAPLFSSVAFKGYVVPAATVQVDLYLWNSNTQAFSIYQSKQSNADGTFQFMICPPRGENQIYAGVGADKSPAVFVNAYNLHLYFEMISNEMLLWMQETYEQNRADAHLDATEDILDSELREPSDEAVDAVWGKLVGTFRPTGMSLDDYRNLIKSVLTAYRTETTYEAIVSFWESISGNPTNRENISFLDWGNVGFKLGTSGKFRVDRTSSPSLTVTWDNMNVWWQDRTGGTNFFETKRGYIKAGSMDVIYDGPGGPSGLFSFYIDGSVDLDGYFIVKMLRYGYGTLPSTAKVLAEVSQQNGDIVKIAGQGRMGTSTYLAYRVGWSFLSDRARINSYKYKGSRFLVYFDNILGSNPMTDPEFTQKVEMVKNILKAIKPAKSTIFFATPPDAHYTEV